VAAHERKTPGKTPGWWKQVTDVPMDPQVIAAIFARPAFAGARYETFCQRLIGETLDDGVELSLEEKQGLLDAVSEALRRLPDEDRRLVEMNIVHGWSLRKMERILAMPRSSIHQRIRVSLKKMKYDLEGDPYVVAYLAGELSG